MNTYQCRFVGRTRNAIGSFIQCEREVVANTIEEAHQMLYETHEHITKYAIINKADPQEYKHSKRAV